MTEYEDSWVSRMGRRTKEMRFVHAVHELMRPLYSPEKKFSNLFAHHVGYVFQNAQEKKKHFQRNITPILEELEHHPENLRLTMQAVQEYMFDEDYEKAEAFCRSAEKNEDPSYEQAWNWIEVVLLRSLMVRERAADTIAEGRRILQSPRINDLARMNIDYILLAAAQKVNDPETELEFAREYARLEQYFDEHPEKVLDDVVLSLSEILKDDKRQKVHDSLFLNYKNLERYSELCDYADSISWKAEYMKQKLHFLFLIEAVSYTGNYDCLTRVTEKICQQGEFPKEWMEEVYRVCNCEDKEKQYQLRKAFAAVNCEEPYFLVLRAWSAEKDGGDVQGILQECLEKGLDCTVPYEDLLGICLQNSIDPTPFLEPLYMEDWAVSFSQLVKNTPKEELQNLLDCVQRTLRPINESYYFVLAKMIRQRMLNDPDFPEDQIWETAKAYVGDIIGYYKGVYRTELLEGSIKQNLPREVVFALKLQEGLYAQEQGNFEDMAQALKECVQAYPPRKDLVNRLLKQVELDMQAEQQRQDEFMAMGEKIKQQIHQMIQLGKLMEAQQILERLKTLLPNDAELEELEQKISMGERLKNLQSLMY